MANPVMRFSRKIWWVALALLQMLQKVIAHLKHNLLAFGNRLCYALRRLLKMGRDGHFGEFADAAEEEHIVFQQAVYSNVPDVFQKLFGLVFLPAFRPEPFDEIAFVEYIQSP